VRQVLAQQKAAPPTQRNDLVSRSPAAPLPAAEPRLPVPANGAMVNEDKLDAWAGVPLTSINFNGNDGQYSALDGSSVLDREFIAFIPRVTEGYTTKWEFGLDNQLVARSPARCRDPALQALQERQTGAGPRHKKVGDA
jgi:hypothetical protein